MYMQFHQFFLYLQGLCVFQPLSTVILCTCTCTWLIIFILSCSHVQPPVLLVVTLSPATRKSASKNMKAVVHTTVFILLTCIFRKSLDELFPLFFSNLEDSIPSVRQGGAVAIANVVRAYGMYM